MTDEERRILDQQADEVTADHQYDFDSELPDTGDGEFQLLPAGFYRFKVLKMVRGTCTGGKLAGSKQAELTLKLEGEGGDGQVIDRLILHKKTIFKVRQFFKSIGQNVVSGQPFRPDWSQVQGAEGELELEIHKFTSTRDGKERESNQVKRYCEPQSELDDF